MKNRWTLCNTLFRLLGQQCQCERNQFHDCKLHKRNAILHRVQCHELLLSLSHIFQINSILTTQRRFVSMRLRSIVENVPILPVIFNRYNCLSIAFLLKKYFFSQMKDNRYSVSCTLRKNRTNCSTMETNRYFTITVFSSVCLKCDFIVEHYEQSTIPKPFNGQSIPLFSQI